MMRLYLRALGELTPPSQCLYALTLNDRSVDPAQLAPYNTPALDRIIACGRNKLAFAWHTLRLSRRSGRIICGHINLLRLAHLARNLHPSLEVWLIAHGIEVWRDFSAGERRALAATRRIVCVSDYTRREIARRCPEITTDRLVVVPNALDPQFEAANTSDGSTQPELILCVARLSAAEQYKGVDHLIRAMPAIAAAIPNARLRIVGDGDDRARLEALARDVGVADRVEFTRRVTDTALREHFAASHLFALPSRGEGFGLVYVEALAHGKPCLVADAGGAPEVVDDTCGARVPFGDVARLAERSIAMLRQRWDTDALRARAREFSYARLTERLAHHLGNSAAAPG